MIRCIYVISKFVPFTILLSAQKNFLFELQEIKSYMLQRRDKAKVEGPGPSHMSKSVLTSIVTLLSLASPSIISLSTNVAFLFRRLATSIDIQTQENVVRMLFLQEI